MRIEEVLARRSDLSTFLVHLCRDMDAVCARERVKSILREERIRAFSPMGPAVEKLEQAGISTESQRTVCFTETPLEHTSLLCEEIENRQCQFKPYGIAVTKRQGRKKGVNPVWYVDITQSLENPHDWLTKPLGKLIDAAIGEHPANPFEGAAISCIAPFVEQMGSGVRRLDSKRYRKEFWWEREWRYRGDFELPSHFIVLCPSEDIDDARGSYSGRGKPAYVDPRWSLEQIIARTAGFAEEDVGPM